VVGPPPPAPMSDTRTVDARRALLGMRIAARAPCRRAHQTVAQGWALNGLGSTLGGS